MSVALDASDGAQELAQEVSDVGSAAAECGALAVMVERLTHRVQRLTPPGVT